MDQTHARALEALQPFVALATSNSATSPRFVANIVTNATSSPQTYVFAELLETPTIQALAASDTPAEYQSYLKLLEIFAWGTWQEYQATPNLPKLSTEQALKLRLLSLLTLAATTKPLTYQALMKALSLSTTAELEALVTTAIYANLISARLSPASTPPTVNVTSVAPLRDVQSQSLPKMVSLLTEWEARCGNVVTDLEAEIARVKANAQKRYDKEQAHQALLDHAVQRRQAETGREGGGNVGNGRASKSGIGRRLAGRMGFGVGSNKRDADDIDVDDGFVSGDNGDSGSRMDIDEGAGMGRGGSRQSKRILGRKA
ncbi:COP9 signalosome complex subunit 7 [Penicillium canariense]|uniref:COP9 signalosome complex subunit 7 n=1 Tax=Penicillium canariense TaxID=189055 RepID=A0A9W9I560_9EURO|nr:COP9 signalosome complex subunit 7 [Penicillium canariense]KAJ5168194.1 COP9 signalosome complex subunit 7 [Penicillium canariense]